MSVMKKFIGKCFDQNSLKWTRESGLFATPDRLYQSSMQSRRAIEIVAPKRDDFMNKMASSHFG